MTGFKSKKAAAQDKMAHMTFEQRCRISEQCLPDAPYRAMLIALHDEMLKALAQPEQEPVAWMSDEDVGFKKSEFGVTPTVPLYTSRRRTMDFMKVKSK